MKNIIIVNGPNLNLLGNREPEIYGSQTFETYFKSLKKEFPSFELDYYQSNIEGEIIDKLQEVGFSYDGIILNAAAYTHTSVALRDAFLATDLDFVEVHLSNVYAREAFRHRSLLSDVAAGVVVGFGPQSYELGLRGLLSKVGT